MNKDEINALHNEFRRCGKNAREWMRQCQMMLPRIRDEEVWKRKGYNSIYDYARILAGMSKNSVDDALWIMDKIANKPELQEIARKKGLSAVRPVVAIATEETSQFWAEKASDMSQNTLKTYVKNSRERVNPSQRTASQDGDMSNTRRAEGLRCEIRREATNGGAKTASMYMKLDVQTIERMKKLKGDKDWDNLLNEMLNAYEKVVDTREKLESCNADNQRSEASVRHCETQEKPSPVSTGKPYVPRKIQKYVTRKTSGLCAYPGCTKPYEILHHTERFALDQTHDPDTLRPLCKAHERLAHKGLIENEENQPVEFIAGGGGRSWVVGGDVLEDKAKIQINWAVKKEADKTNRKYGIDKKVNEYYMPKLE